MASDQGPHHVYDPGELFLVDGRQHRASRPLVLHLLELLQDVLGRVLVLAPSQRCDHV